MRDQDSTEKLHAAVDVGWQQVEEGKMSDFDSKAVKPHDRDKLAALRNAIKAGLESGPAEPFDMDEILAEARNGRKLRT